MVKGKVFFSSGLISVVNIFVFGGSVSARWITYEYSIDDVTATWIEVIPVSPMYIHSASIPRSHRIDTLKHKGTHTHTSER